MFLHRLKIEIRENRIFLIIWAFTLVGLGYAAISFWNGKMAIDPRTGSLLDSSLAILAILMAPLIFVPIVTTITTFRQDNLKDPRAFWNTRPLRPGILHRTKFIFLHLFFTLPLFLFVLGISLNATDFRTSMIFAIEAALWCAATIHLCGLAALHNHQWSHIFLIPANGFIGAFLAAFIANKLAPHQLTDFDIQQATANILYTIAILLVVFVVGAMVVIKKPHFKFPIWVPVLIGALTFPMLSANLFPRLGRGADIVTYENSDPITEFSTTNYRQNEQYFYLLNYQLDELLKDTDRHPVSLISHKVDYDPNVLNLTGSGLRIREWQSGINSLPHEKNLESIARRRTNGDDFNISLTVRVPHDFPVQTAQNFDDIPRKNITISGEVEILTVSLDDAFLIDPDERLEHQTPGSKFVYQPTSKKDRPHGMFTKNFTLPLVSAEALGPNRRVRSDDPIIFLRHRKTNQWFPIQDGNERAQYGMFGSIHYIGIQNPKDSSMVTHYWENRLQSELPDFPDFEDWEKEADLHILPSNLFKPIKVPFTVTLAVPDLRILQERLNGSK